MRRPRIRRDRAGGCVGCLAVALACLAIDAAALCCAVLLAGAALEAVGA